jgi:predicted nucleic acid-binding protein
MRFFDASALVKRYVREPESTRVRRLLRAGDVALCRLSEVEVIAAFARLAHAAAISPAERDRAATAFVADIPAWTVVEVTPEVTRTARRLLLQHPLRSGDAVQLGAALLLQEAMARPLQQFVAYERRLVDAARAEQLSLSRAPP